MVYQMQRSRNQRPFSSVGEHPPWLIFVKKGVVEYQLLIRAAQG